MPNSSFPQKAAADMRVLVVGDNPLQIGYVAALVKSLGINNVVTADNGTEALAIVEKQDNDLDLIISELMMPTMDGFYFLWQLAYRHYQVPVIIMSDGVDRSHPQCRISRTAKIS